MKPTCKILFFLIALLAATRISPAQEGSCEKRLVPAFVTDKNGNILRTLSATDFKLESYGIPMSMVSRNPDGRVHRVVIVLDVSASMKGRPGSGFWNVVLGLVQHLSSIESDNAQFALLLFSDHVVQTVEFSEGKDALRRRVEEISKNPNLPEASKENGSRIYDAVGWGIQLLEKPTSADSLLVITDGVDEGSKSRPEEVLNQLSGPMVRVFSILVEPVFLYVGKESEPLGSVPNEFIEFAKRSGGEVFGPVDKEKVGLSNQMRKDVAVREMVKRLVEFYAGILQNDVLTIQVPPGIQKPEAIGISLADSAGDQWKKAKVYFPRQIGPCLDIRPSAKVPN
jgi:von Willebrand factor type A domain